MCFTVGVYHMLHCIRALCWTFCIHITTLHQFRVTFFTSYILVKFSGLKVRIDFLTYAAA